MVLTPFTLVNVPALLLYDEIKVPDKVTVPLFEGDRQAFNRLLRKIQLTRHLRPAIGLHFHMDVLDGSALVQAGENGLEIITPLGVGELMPAQAIARVIIFTACIRLPEIEPGVGQRLAVLIENVADKDQPRAGHPFFEQGVALRRICFVIWTLRLSLGQAAARRHGQDDPVLSEEVR